MTMENEQKEYTKASPNTMPPPTYWPFVVAISLLFVGWGLLTVWVMAVAGLIGMIVAIRGWIKDLLYEQRNNERKPEKLSH